MEKVIVGIVLLLVVLAIWWSSTRESTPVEVDHQSAYTWSMEEANGHEYIIIDSYRRAGMTHNPDCKFCRANEKTN